VSYQDERGDDVLVLTRKQGEVITVGDDLEIHIIKVYADRVRIGIIAPDNVAVHRKEVADQIEAQLQDESPG